MRRMSRVALLLLVAATSSIRFCAAAEPAALTVATWNLEWLVTPGTAHAARMACLAGRRSSLPCDVALRSRDSADLARLASYARETNADIFAFQEVESAAIAGRIFRGYAICMASGRGVQHVGFAVRPGLPHRCGNELESLTLDATQRAGMTLWFAPDTPEAIELLAIHLKSGCADAALDSGTAACSILARQSHALAQWISQRAAGGRFLVLGDFNRGDDDITEDPFWLTLAGGGQPPFLLAGQGAPFRGCHRGEPYTRAIDHLLVSRALVASLLPGTHGRVNFRSADLARYRLSDHCPVRISLSLDRQPAPGGD